MSALPRRSVLLGGAGLILSACSEKREQPPPLITERTAPSLARDPHIERVSAVNEILARRVKAVRDGDERVFLADLDQTNTALVQQQRMLFANLRQFKLTTFNYVIPPAELVEVSGEQMVCPVVGIIQFSIDDAGTGVMPGETFQYTLVQRDGQFRIKDITAKTEQNAGTLNLRGPMADAPWNSTPLKVTTVGNVWLASDASVTDLDAYISAAQHEAQRIDTLWGSRTRYPGSLLFLTRDSEAFKTWYSFGSAGNYKDTIEGIAPHPEGVRTNGEPYTGQHAGSRAVVNLKRVDAIDDDPRRVIRHELAHGVTARARMTASGFINGHDGPPLWAVEGFAAWTETLDSPALAAAYRRGANTGFNGKLPRSTDFYSKNSGGNYAMGAAAFLLAEKLKGRQAAVDFYASLIQHTDLGDLAVAEMPVFDGICKQALGISAASYTSQWAAYVKAGA
ncbi:hypothetical protein [Catellatospora chokoriensis]|uniref:Uncharacterized protein n=1 Tax=Catellatospora chokoriensis TaxID=310353 RepID=A0A8J3JSV4_9ACTN|nr:hypothetical protein [Catellatospora chokoriensis]GIF90452.1 hypothetical protein Cch02nite_38960 [Catellatospora chokoriensis]